jgi:toxin ParE1/3/4
MYEHIFEPKAQREYEQSIKWYSERSQNATLNFIKSVDQAIELICDQPNQFKNIHKNYHEINTKNYPFTIVYTIEEKIKTVIIYSIHQNKRNPRKKYKRIKK